MRGMGECAAWLRQAGHVQSHLRWGFGGGFAAPEDIFVVFWRLRRQNTTKMGFGAQPQGLCTCPASTGSATTASLAELVEASRRTATTQKTSGGA